MKNCIQLFVVFTLTLFGVTEAHDELLKKSDIEKVMKQILKQHVDKNTMSVPILKTSFKNYIDQFDPDRIYLLEGEVRPYLKPTDTEVAQMLEQYKRNDLSSFEHLNALIQKSIGRARQYRKELANEAFWTKQGMSKNGSDEALDKDQRRFFVKSDQQLKARMREDYMTFIQNEIKRYGESTVKKQEAKNYLLYDKELRHEEDQYLGTNEAGTPLSPPEQENLFVMHVLKALASSLDSHTKVMNANEAYDMKVRLEKGYEGIGVRLKPRGSEIVVSGLVEGSPAAKSGLIKLNDRIMEIDGHPIADESFGHVLEMIRNPKAATIGLTLKRTVSDNQHSTEKIIPVSIKRELITVNEGRVESAFVPFDNGIIGVISLHAFYQGIKGVSSEEDVRQAIKKLSKQGTLKGLVLDLRDNMGGFLTQAVKVAGLFISTGIIVISKYSNGEEHFYRDVDDTQLFDGPLVILTSKETASAAEIVAQSLQDYGVALVVGDEHTYGKGTIQSQTVTGGDESSSYFKVTVGKYYTVSGKTPQLQGVKADIVVPTQYSREAIGEEYLENPEPADKIPPSYEDKLSDVDPIHKSWFLRYYAPKTQHKKTFWLKELPELQKNSANRISHNPQYQQFLKLLKDGKSVSAPVDTKQDLQMEEAVNVVKDMIRLQTRDRGKDVSPSPSN